MLPKRGIAALAITDHNSVKGGLETATEAKNAHSKLLVINGVEISTNRGHVIGLFIQENIICRDYWQVLDEINGQDGLVVIPHPCKKSQKFSEKEFAKAHLFEGLNGRSTNKENQLAMDLANRLDKRVVAGSDSHFPFELGRVRTILPWEPSDLDELKKMLRNGAIAGIETSVDHLSPYFTHFLSCSLEISRTLF